MEGKEIIRAYMLEPGEIFQIGEVRYRVLRVENGKIYYCYFWPKNPKLKNRILNMGANSEQKLILITNKTKQNEHQN